MIFLPNVEAEAIDPLLGLIARIAADPREDKIDLGVGMYRDADGETRVLASVKAAEAVLLEQQQSKGYLGSEGDAQFTRLLSERVFGPSRSVAALQTPGGTGALRLAADLLAAGGARRVILATPTWPNHSQVFAAAGLTVTLVPSYDVTSRRFMPERLLDACERAETGDGVLLHGCCHNPTGADLDLDDWRALARIVAQRGLVPLIDVAYQGFGRGWDEDAIGFRTLLAQVSGALVAYSCSKNFGLYRDRVGALYIHAASAKDGDRLGSRAGALARRNWSMPPDHGAAVVRTILSDPMLEAQWRRELEAMRKRVVDVRERLAAYGAAGEIDLATLTREQGMFAMLPLTVDQVAHLADRYAIYMAPSGRINVAGLTASAVDRFVTALKQVTERVTI